MRLELALQQARLRAPLLAAHDSVAVRPLIQITLTDADGVIGRGEAAPLEGYDGVTVAAVMAGLGACRPALSASAGDADRAALLAACAERTVVPQALAAVDLALWDLAGRRAGQPIWRLLGAQAPAPVEVNAMIGAEDRAGVAREAAAAAAAGFRTIKLKVGVGDDACRLAAVRAAVGPNLRIRLDANGAWSVAEAIAHLRVLEPAGIELCEEPVHGVTALAEVARASSVPVAADESGAEPGLLATRACDSICLKVARCGGITGVLRDAGRARAAGYRVYLASTLDGPLGIAAALHAATVIAPDRPCGLATLARFEAEDPLPPAGGSIAVPSGPGLGDL